MPRYRIPVRVVDSTARPSSKSASNHLEPSRPHVRAEEEARDSRTEAAKGNHVTEPAPGRPEELRAPGEEPREVAGVSSEEAYGPDAQGSGDCSDVEWRERALHLQAEMENYRKRQQRVAREQVRGEQERLLLDVLTIADNLDRTLSAAQTSVLQADESIQQGVALTRDELDHILSRYEVERIAALHRPFDPMWHEALGVTSAKEYGVAPDTVIEVLQAGYRRGERLLRPARVVVAQ
jgi:molecular chaperone GrpE